MDDSDTATVELTRPEARKVINALSKYQMEASGRDETRALEVRDFLQREFGFKERHFASDRQLGAAFGDLVDEDDDHEIQLSRAEAVEVVQALDDLEAESAPSDATTIADIRDRFETTFEMEAGAST